MSETAPVKVYKDMLYEITDRAYVQHSSFVEYVQGHQALKLDRDLSALAEIAEKALFDVYQAAGAKLAGKFTSKRRRGKR